MVDRKTLRVFGYIWALIFLVISYTENMSSIFVTISVCFLLSSTFYPEVYRKTRMFQVWTKFGNILGKVNSYIIIFVLFFMIFTPIGITLRLLGKDLLNKKLDRRAKSYFIARNIQPGSMVNQF